MKLYIYLALAAALLISFAATYTFAYTKGFNSANVEQLRITNEALQQANVKLSNDNESILQHDYKTQNLLKARDKNVNKLQAQINTIDLVVLSDKFVQLYNYAVSKNGTTESYPVHARSTRKHDTAELLRNVMENAEQYYVCQSKVEAWQDYYRLVVK